MKLVDYGGYSAKNFLEATRDSGQIYSIDLNHVPKQAPNHFTIQKDANDIDGADVGNSPIDMVFFDCHSFEGQMNCYHTLSKEGIITDRTIIAFHDTNLFHSDNLLPETLPPGHRVEGGWRPIFAEAQMVNSFKKMGYDIFCFHPELRVHFDPSEDLPYRWGLTIASRFNPLPV